VLSYAAQHGCTSAVVGALLRYVSDDVLSKAHSVYGVTKDGALAKAPRDVPPPELIIAVNIAATQGQVGRRPLPAARCPDPRFLVRGLAINVLQGICMRRPPGKFPVGCHARFPLSKYLTLYYYCTEGCMLE
jgi:hypothetical protein